MSERSPREIAALARALSRWFEAEARQLSWRETRDPYAIWVSEIMLQQTRVDTVERYWPRFMARFPDVASLATADEDAVLEQWSGLGYYRRARLLHRGARHVVEELGGVLPNEARSLRAIPGVGRYTAGAIASIAFDRPAPLVDGNVARVHSRLAAIPDPREQDASHEGHWRFVAQVLAEGSPRVLAQALMELGATVCTPRTPSCERCPIQADCQAFASDLQARIPAPKRKKAPTQLDYVALALRFGERLLIERRPSEGLLAGMWCLPLFEREPGPVRVGEREDLAAAASAQLGIDVQLDEAPTTAVKHVFSHRIWQLLPWSGRARRALKIRRRSDGREFAWLAPGAEPDGGVPTLTRKLFAALAR